MIRRTQIEKKNKLTKESNSGPNKSTEKGLHILCTECYRRNALISEGTQNITQLEAASCSSTQLEVTTRNIKTAAIATGNTISKGIPGGVEVPIRSGPTRRMATMIKNITTEP